MYVPRPHTIAPHPRGQGNAVTEDEQCYECPEIEHRSFDEPAAPHRPPHPEPPQRRLPEALPRTASAEYDRERNIRAEGPPLLGPGCGGSSPTTRCGLGGSVEERAAIGIPATPVTPHTRSTTWSPLYRLLREQLHARRTFRPLHSPLRGTGARATPPNIYRPVLGAEKGSADGGWTTWGPLLDLRTPPRASQHRSGETRSSRGLMSILRKR